MTGDPARPGPPASAERVFDAYVPRLVLHHLAREPFHPVHTVEGSMLFADLSGFTRLSEKLQRRGPEGAELLVTTINGVFGALLRIAYDNGGSLIKFGGDALLIFFDGAAHASRAAHAAFRMRERLRTVGRLEVSGVRGVLRMTVGVHSDEFHFLLVGDSHLEHLVLGPGAAGIVATEAFAENGQIVVSTTTAALLPDRCCGQPAGLGRLLVRSPPVADLGELGALPRPPDDLVGRALSTAVRAHVLEGRAAPEHRRASVAFLQFSGANAIIDADGIDVAAAAVHELVAQTQRAADTWEICFLDSDIDADGGKLLLTAGAPRVVGDDEERMLLALRQILDGRAAAEFGNRLPVRIGVNRGPVFTGEIGPPYRRSYIVMGDTTNLAARVMSKAPPGALYATPGILEQSTTRFVTEALTPFAAKGKSRPVQAHAVGPALRSVTVARGERERLVLVGRDAEVEVLDAALAGLDRGTGAAVEVVGDLGLGKSRLLAEACVRAGDVPRTAITCEAHTAATPYAAWQALLPDLLGLGPAATGSDAYSAVLSRSAWAGEDLMPWAPLLADVLGVEVGPTEEVAALAPEFRRARVQEVAFRFLAPELALPRVLAVDNVHLMDEASRALVEALIARLDQVPWVVLLAGRPGPVWDTAGPIVRLELAPLGPFSAVVLAELVTDTHPLPPHVVMEAVERSGGNPQFLLDLLDAAVGGLAELPESVQAAAMAVIDALPPSDRTLVRRLSVIGAGFTTELLDALELGAGHRWDQVWHRLGAVFDVAPGGRVSFRRGAVAEAAYAGVPFAERRALHAAVAAALAAEGGESADPAVLSLHYRRAGRHDLAYPLAQRAADRAVASGAPADAARLYRAALESARDLGLPARDLAAVWEGFGDALRLAGEGDAADRAYRQARRAVGADPLRRARLYHRQARLAQRAGRSRAGVRWARRGARVLADVPGPEAAGLRAALLATEAADRMDQGRRVDAVRLCRQALAEAPENGSPVAERARAHASYLLDWALVTLGRADEAVHSAAALEIYTRLGDLDEQSSVLNNLGGFAYYAGKWDVAVRRYRECAELAERIGNVEVVAWSDLNTAEVLSDQGRWAEAETNLTRALRIWRASGNAGQCAFAHMLLGRTLARAGRVDEGLALLDSAVAEFTAVGMANAVLAEGYRAEALAYAGRTEEARTALASLQPRAPAALAPLLLRARAVASAEAGRPAVLAGLVEALAAARREGADFDAAAALDLLCVLTGDQIERHPDAAQWTAGRAELLARLDIRRLPTALIPGSSGPAGSVGPGS